MWAADGEKKTGKSVRAHNNGRACVEKDMEGREAGLPEGLAEPGSLASRYGGFVYWLAFYLLDNAEYAEDVFEKTFWEHEFEQAKPKQSEPTALSLARIALSQSFAILRIRNAAKLTSLSLEAKDDVIPAPETLENWGDARTHYSAGELRNIVHEGLQGMTPFARTIFVLREVGRLTTEEIAGLLHLSVQQTESHILRSRLQLRERLSERFGSNLKKKTQTA